MAWDCCCCFTRTTMFIMSCIHVELEVSITSQGFVHLYLPVSEIGIRGVGRIFEGGFPRACRKYAHAHITRHACA